MADKDSPQGQAGLWKVVQASPRTLASSPEGDPGGEKRRNIRVVCDNNYPPYAFKDAEGRLRGIVPDQWRAWERATGLNVDLRGFDWAEAIAAFEGGEADVLDTVFKTEERLKRYDFTEPYARLEVPIFIHKSLSGISSVEDLKGLKVAAKNGDAAVGELIHRGVSEISLFTSYEEIVDAAVRLDIRAFCIDKPPAIYLLYKRGADQDFRIAFVLNEGAFHRAILKGRPELLALVKQGFASINQETYASIDRSWFGSELGRFINLELVGIVGAVVALVILLLVFLAWTLKRRVAAATAELRDKVRLLEESEAKNRALIEALPDMFFTVDREGRFLDVSESARNIVKLPPEFFIGKRAEELAYIPGQWDEFTAKLKEAFETGRMTLMVKSLDFPDGERHFEGRIVPISNSRAVLFARDMTERLSREDLLRRSVAEKEALLKEVHHRVKNNLQVISSLMNLRSDALKDPEDVEIFVEIQQRIRSMAQIHELLYRSRDLASADAAEYLESIVQELSLGYGATSLACRAEPVRIGLDEAVPLGLIANELILNAVKYAYEGNPEGPMAVSLYRDGADLVLRVSDEGRGLPAGVDPAASASMGFTLVRSLAAQLGGRMSFEGPPGFAAELRYPL